MSLPFSFVFFLQYFVAIDIVCVSVIFICSPHNEYNFLLAGRTLSGMLYGIILLTIVLHTADNANQFVRRYLLWTIVIVNILPTILLAELIAYAFNIAGGLNVAIGCVMLMLSVIALIVMPWTYESIVFLLDTGRDLKALEVLLKLRNESRHFIRNDFNDMKLMIAEDRNVGDNLLRHGNWRPLVLILLLRLLNSFVANNILASVSVMNIWLDYQHVTMRLYGDSAAATVNNKNINNDDDSNDTNYYHLNETRSSNYSLIDDFAAMLNDGYESMANVAATINDDAEATTIAAASDAGDDFKDIDFIWNSTTTLVPNTTGEWFGTTDTIIEQVVTDSNELYFIHSAYEYQPCILNAQYILLFIFVVKLIVGVPLLCWAEKLYIFRNRFVFKATLAVAILNLTFCTMSWCSYKLEDRVLIFTYYIFKLQNLINGLFMVVAFAIDVIGLNELAEGFSSVKRTASIAFIFMVEYLVHFVYFMPLLINHHLPFYLNFIHWTIIICITYLLILFMPNECLDKTLRNARDKYFVSI